MIAAIAAIWVTYLAVKLLIVAFPYVVSLLLIATGSISIIFWVFVCLIALKIFLRS